MDQSILAYVPSFGLDQIGPFLILTVGAIAILVLDAILKPGRRDAILAFVTLAALLAAGFTFYADVIGTEYGSPFLEGALRADQFGKLGCLVIVFGALAFVLLSPRLIRERRLPAGEMYALLLFSVTGMTLLAVANELLTAFICIEILSICLYVLAGIDRRNRRSGEAAFKYFILGAFASAFLVMGTAFLFGATGTTQLMGSPTPAPELSASAASYDLAMNEVLYTQSRLVHGSVPDAVMAEEAGAAARALVVQDVPAVSYQDINPVWVFVGFALLLVGICFKLSLAPFHMWAPDVYEGAPTIVTMLIATASKVGAFAFLVHVIQAMSYWEYFPHAAGFLLGAVAVVSMLWGNLGAIVQTNIKRMLAYSSIAHGGYMTVGAATLVAPAVFANEAATGMIRDSIVFYLFAYTMANTVAFGTIAYLGRNGEGDIAAYRGLSRRQPWLAAGMALAMVSLLGLGIPGTIGFWGKYYVFKEAIGGGLATVAVIAMVASAISAFYYLRVVVAMYMQEPEEGAAIAGEHVATANGYRLVLALTCAFIVLFGFVPALFFAIGV